MLGGFLASSQPAAVFTMLVDTKTAFICLTTWSLLTQCSLIRSTSECAPNEYWCQDRCGSDEYGDTCCETPDGGHNLCGLGMFSLSSRIHIVSDPH